MGWKLSLNFKILEWRIWDSFKFSISFAKFKDKDFISFLSTILFTSVIFTNLRGIYKEKYSSKSLWTHYHKRPQCSSFTEKLMHETISLGQQKVFIQSHKHSFQGRFFSSVTLNSFDTKAFVCLQTEFSVLLIVFFPSSTYLWRILRRTKKVIRLSN